jgi:acyl-coenzyme A thioesterase 13
MAAIYGRPLPRVDGQAEGHAGRLVGPHEEWTNAGAALKLHVAINCGYTVWTMQVPSRFSRFQSSPFSELVGPFYRCHDGELPVVGLVVLPDHANTMGSAHGALLAALADVALGQAIKVTIGPELAAVTANLNIAYLGSAAVGDWIEASPTIDHRGRWLIFAACELRSPAGVIARVSATFAIGAAEK